MLAEHRGNALSAAAIAREANEDLKEVELLLGFLERSAYIVCTSQGKDAVYKLNEAQGTIGRVLNTFEDREQIAEGALILRSDEYGWTAELPQPAGLIVRGATREEACERGVALMKKMASLPGANSQ